MNNKQTVLVPKLRFPEFVSTGEWQAYRLDEIADRLTEKVGDRQLTTLSISAGSGFVSQAEKFSRDISGKQYENYIILKKGDFSYNKGNSKKFPQGCVYELKEYEKAAVPNAFISFHFKDNFVSSFYKGYFENNFHGKQLMKFITSGARMDGLLNINPSDFFSITLPTPFDKKEQQKIADCLSSLDELIIAEDNKIDALKSHKKGLMQKIFPVEGKTMPEWRFPKFRDNGEWTTNELGDLGAIVTGKTPNTADETLWNGDIQFVTPTDIAENKYQLETQRTVANTSKIKVLPANSIMFTCIASVGKMAISVYPCITNQQINTVIPFKTVYGEYVYYALLKKSTNIKATLANSTLPIINKTEFSKILLAVPEQQEEQLKIADCLSSLDVLISEQAKKIEELKNHKKGLMQGLFPTIEEVSE